MNKPVDNGDGTHTANCTKCDFSTTEDHNFVDGTCDKCGAKEVVECEHEWKLTTIITYPTKDTEGSGIYTCSLCEETKTDIIPVVVGELDTSLTNNYNFAIGDTCCLTFRIPTSALNKYENYYLVIDRNTRDDNFNFKPAETFFITKEEATETTNTTYFYYYGIELYSLNVPVTATIYGVDAEGNYKYNTFVSTLADVLKTRVLDSSTKSTLRTACTDLLNAGVAVQTYFKGRYPNSDYANLSLPIDSSFTQAYATPDSQLLYASYNSTESATGVEMKGGGAFGASPYVSFNFPADINNQNKYVLKLSYYNTVKKETVYKEVTGSEMLVSGGKLYGYFYDLAIYAGNADIKAEVYYDGNETPLVTNHYCFDVYAKEKVEGSNANLANAAKACVKLGVSFRAHKGVS